MCGTNSKLLLITNFIIGKTMPLKYLKLNNHIPKIKLTIVCSAETTCNFRVVSAKEHIE